MQYVAFRGARCCKLILSESFRPLMAKPDLIPGWALAQREHRNVEELFVKLKVSLK